MHCLRHSIPFLAAAALAFGQQADLILAEGKIWTGERAQPEVEAVACDHGRIVAAGTNAGILKLAGVGTRIIRLGGKRAVPGFNDSHVHFFDGGQGISSVQLRDARTEAEFSERIGTFAQHLPKGRWILQGNWDHENFPSAKLPVHELIDAATMDNPVWIQRLDGHMGLGNSLALKLAGVTRETQDPPGGTIVHNAHGEPTGILKDAAMSLIERVIPVPSEAELEVAVRAAMRYAAERGVTSVEDMSATPEMMRVYQKLLRKNELTVRVSAHFPLADWRKLADLGILQGFGGNRLKIGSLKGFADGSLGSTTALFYAPYLDQPDTAGLAGSEMIPESKMLNRIVDADAAGLQIAVHAIGDKANATILDMFAEAERRNGVRDRRFRIEHAQHLNPDLIRRFASQHVIASMQPYHAIDDGRWAEKRIGPERAKGAYAFQSLLDAGAVLAFGSDWFVAPMDPLMGIYGAVTRRTLDEKNPNGWVPEQKISVAEAVRAYTWGGAYASFDEPVKGTITAGRLADFAVLSDDIFTIDPVAIRKTRVVMTVFDGRVVYSQ